MHCKGKDNEMLTRVVGVGTLLPKLNCSDLKLNLLNTGAQDIPRVGLCQDFMRFELRVASSALPKKSMAHSVKR